MKCLRNYISLFIKFSIFIFVILGIIFSAKANDTAFMGNGTTFLFFTIQSNLWIGATSLLGFIIILLSIFKDKNYYKRYMFIIKLVFTISITLTGLVFVLVLAPTMSITNPNLENFNLWNFSNVATHVLVPGLSIIDLFIFKGNYPVKKLEVFYVTIPPFYYLFFSTIGYYCNWDFGGGNNYPYFFMNFDSPAGFFGFSSTAPYFMGTFYWIILLTALVVGIGYLYRFIIIKLNKITYKNNKEISDEKNI